jgi:hypothetical protein
MLMIDAAKALNLKAFYVPDRKRILIDGAVPKLKHRWIEAHEITHDLLPWHHEMMLGDTTHTLTVTCHEMLEGEANYGAGQLLFLRNRFVEEARASAISFDVVKTLKIRFGNTMTTTLWRYVESVFPERAMIGIVSVHPHPTMRPADFNPLDPCRYFIRSQTFANHFPHVTEIEMFAILESYCAPRRGGPLGTMEFTLTDANGDVQLFTAETFSTSMKRSRWRFIYEPYRKPLPSVDSRALPDGVWPCERLDGQGPFFQPRNDKAQRKAPYLRRQYAELRRQYEAWGRKRRDATP